MITNATKYGSLSAAGGRLDVTWKALPNGDCEMEWIESGGPIVNKPSRRGFGSTLIEKTIEFDLSGAAELDFARGELRARFVIPAEHHHVVTAQQRIPIQATMVYQPLEGLSVLLVEDQALIALDTEELLRDLGAADVQLQPNVAAALQSLSEETPHCAVLDLNLGRETSEAVAIDLRKRGIPFVFATGYRDSVSIPEEFESVPVVRKPIPADALARQLVIALGA